MIPTTLIPAVPVRRRWAGRVLLLGPALVAAAAYVDPGNVATNTAAGARYGHQLVWVVVVANSMAGLVQYLAAKLGVVTGRSLPELLQSRLSPRRRLAFWAQAEVVTMATDLAEVVGGAVAFHILFRLPLLGGGLLTTAASLAILHGGREVGARRFQRVIIAMLGVVALGFTVAAMTAPPAAGALASGLLPGFSDRGSLVLAVGILGATVMPHAVYAHSALARDGSRGTEAGMARRTVLASTRIDVTVALLVAGAVNLALLLVGAELPAGAGSVGIDDVHAGLAARAGPVVALMFAIGLLFSGIASTAVGCYSGAVVMDGLLQVRLSPVRRRLVTAMPALLLLALGAPATDILLASQVVLSFGIPFALVPLVVLTSRRTVMGKDVNRASTTGLAAAACAIIVGLNAVLIVFLFRGLG